MGPLRAASILDAISTGRTTTWNSTGGGRVLKRHQLLKALHKALEPRTYLEIGVRDGLSLRLSRAQSIAVDPFYSLTAEVRCDLHLVRASSDEFFARPHPLAHFSEPVVDLAFVDGMHLADYALRDFMNIERFCHPGTVIVLDDILPRSAVEGARRRAGAARHGAWAGDVYKVVEVLRRRRGDLQVYELDTFPTGTLVVMLPDPSNRVLDACYDDLVEQLVADRGEVPSWATTRSRALPPERLLRSPVWRALRCSRGLRADAARATVTRALEDAALRRAGPGEADGTVQR